MKKVLLVASFFFAAPAAFLFTLAFLGYATFHKTHGTTGVLGITSKPGVTYAALPSLSQITQDEITQIDRRVENVQQFFARYNSPLEPFAQHVIDAAINYGIDFRLLPAIAMQESNLCKKAPKNSYNCWGFGIYGKKVTRFENYPEAINTVTKTLAKEYKAKGLETPEEIVSKYTPSDNGKWVNSVLHFMNVLQ